MRSYESDIWHHDMAASKSFVDDLKKQQETVKR